LGEADDLHALARRLLQPLDHLGQVPLEVAARRFQLAVSDPHGAPLEFPFVTRLSLPEGRPPGHEKPAEFAGSAARVGVGFVSFHSTQAPDGTKWNGTERNGTERNETKWNEKKE